MGSRNRRFDSCQLDAVPCVRRLEAGHLASTQATPVRIRPDARCITFAVSRGRSSSWVEHPPCKRDVAGSSPTVSTQYQAPRSSEGERRLEKAGVGGPKPPVAAGPWRRSHKSLGGIRLPGGSPSLSIPMEEERRSERRQSGFESQGRHARLAQRQSARSTPGRPGGQHLGWAPPLRGATEEHASLRSWEWPFESVCSPVETKLGWPIGRAPARRTRRVGRFDSATEHAAAPAPASRPRLRTRIAPSEGATGCSTQPEGTQFYGSPADGDRPLSDPAEVRLLPGRRWSYRGGEPARDAGEAGSCPVGHPIPESFNGRTGGC